MLNKFLMAIFCTHSIPVPWIRYSYLGEWVRKSPVCIDDFFQIYQSCSWSLKLKHLCTTTLQNIVDLWRRRPIGLCCALSTQPLEHACHSAQGLLAQHGTAGSKGRREHSKGVCRPATFEPWSGAVLGEHSLWLTGGSSKPYYNSSFSQAKSREQEKWYEVIFPAPPAKLKILFKWELSPEPSDRNLFELRVNQKQF